MPRLAESISVVGNGVVGSAIVRGLLEHCGEMRVYDVVPEKATHSLAACLESDWVFVAVPTNGNDEGYDLAHLKDFFGKIRGYSGRVVLKSTVLPGTTDWLSKEYDIPRLMFSPEHLTARCSFVDFQSPTRNIVGDTERSGAWDAGCELVELYKKRFPGVRCLLMTAREAEFSKLAINTIFANTILLWNHIYDVCTEAGLDFPAVQRAILTDGRIPHSHCEPVMLGGRGAGGYCLPKELSAFVVLQRLLGIDPTMMEAADAYNKRLLAGGK